MQTFTRNGKRIQIGVINVKALLDKLKVILIWQMALKSRGFLLINLELKTRKEVEEIVQAAQAGEDR